MIKVHFSSIIKKGGDFMKKEKQEQLVSYLLNNVPVTREEILEYFHDHDETTYSMSTLTDNLKDLRRLGYIIDAPKRSGYINSISVPKNDEVFELTKDNTIYCALMLMILSITRKPSTLDEIVKKCSDFELDNFEIKTKFRIILHQLVKDNYVLKKNNRYLIHPQKSLFIIKNEDTIKDFMTQFNEQIQLSQFPQELVNFYTTVSQIYGYELKIKEYNSYVHRSIKKISKKEQDIINELYNLDFKNKQLLIEYKTTQKKAYSYCFSVGMIVYSFEKNQIFIIGESQQSPLILKLQNILDMQETKYKNKIYESSYYHRLFNEMFSISIEEPIKVKILFQDFDNHNIHSRIKHLLEIRNTEIDLAKITYIANSNQFIYEDTIRGIHDFARYLRTFGTFAKVLEPQELKDIMIASANRMIERYKERGIE